MYLFQVATAGRRGVNTSFLTAARSPSAPRINGSLNAAGFIETADSLQLKKNPRVFAAGDVVAFPEQHTLIKAGAHAPLIAGNIITLINAEENKGDGKLKRYSKATDSIIITNGRVSEPPFHFSSDTDSHCRLVVPHTWTSSASSDVPSSWETGSAPR
jgi:hypothetical protein